MTQDRKGLHIEDHTRRFISSSISNVCRETIPRPRPACTACLMASFEIIRKRIFGENNYTIIDNVDRLPENLPQLFSSLTS